MWRHPELELLVPLIGLIVFVGLLAGSCGRELPPDGPPDGHVDSCVERVIYQHRHMYDC